MVNKQLFFNNIRETSLFGGKLTQGQVSGMEALIDMADGMIKEQLAYVLATVYHETDRTMQPIEEYGKGKGKPYGKKLKYGGGQGKRIPYTTPDKIYYGRGFTQNTWYEIYQKLTKENTHGWDFLNNPELLLQLQPSAWAVIYGMETGLYTGRKLSHYINGIKCDYYNARIIINGTDKAQKIEGYANVFLKALS